MKQNVLFVGGPMNAKVLELEPKSLSELIWSDKRVDSNVKDVRYIRRQWCYTANGTNVLIYVYLQKGK